jgi:hypothetical protein
LYVRIGALQQQLAASITPPATTGRLTVQVLHVDNQLAIYLNGFKVYSKTSSPGIPEVNDTVDLTAFLRPGLNSLLFVGANVSDQWHFEANVSLGDAIIARYDEQNPLPGQSQAGFVWEATMMLDVM